MLALREIKTTRIVGDRSGPNVEPHALMCDDGL